jgi:hypothetical protein
MARREPPRVEDFALRRDLRQTRRRQRPVHRQQRQRRHVADHAERREEAA